ncbi:hypothetical protein BT96DRAFT_942874 [Gymnopus androsaceus JB14]|uniref:Uncharacterized protein n=1 Tax=Gymnopus androsaceus JB14 TaxID=1447944 RepID=A0A6A4HAQ2_9AGAR|nr:hypothetical protein BT96DRAFT_942874 [Gymnopus androsaceus JB14]
MTSRKTFNPQAFTWNGGPLTTLFIFELMLISVAAPQSFVAKSRQRTGRIESKGCQAPLWPKICQLASLTVTQIPNFGFWGLLSQDLQRSDSQLHNAALIGHPAPNDSQLRTKGVHHRVEVQKKAIRRGLAAYTYAEDIVQEGVAQRESKALRFQRACFIRTVSVFFYLTLVTASSRRTPKRTFGFNSTSTLP